MHTNGRTGACNARNIGIEAAMNEWVAFNDSDDFWRIDKLDYIEGAIKNDFLRKMLANNMISTQCLISKKNTLIDCGYFDIHLKRFQDWEFALRIACKSQGFYISEPLALCIESSDSISKGFR